MTAEGKALKEHYQWDTKAQWNGKPLEGDIELSITLYFGNKRRADLDSFNKLSLLQAYRHTPRRLSGVAKQLEP
jgi:hypothetical protein